MVIDLPPEFIQTIKNTFGEEGKHWLLSFPDLLDEASRRWNLIDIRPVPNLSYNFVVFAHTLPSSTGMLREGVGGDGNVVLKLGVPCK